MHYFTPKFWLGMTASPDRPDGFDIYKLFDHNIAYEIRLQQAMEEDLLCPFHYYGITDVTIDDVSVDEEDIAEAFRKLVSDRRVEHIIEQINFYGYSGDRVKGLIFCSKNDEAEILSEKFNAKGYRTIALSGKNSIPEREAAIEKLTGDDPSHYYDYIFSVDIFNEGVDVPEINQVVMLRPTESAIIFVQQLGRGLRKYSDKEFVIVLDFIANYKNNFLIPIALSGDRTYNKDNIRHYLMDGHKVIPGSSSIHFDEIAKAKIYESISTIKNDSLKFLNEKYRLLKFKLGRIPSIMDFYEHSEIDPLLILDKKRTYQQFLEGSEPEYTVRLSEREISLLTIFSSLMVNGQRPHEAMIIRTLLTQDLVTEVEIAEALADNLEIQVDAPSVVSAFRYLCGEFSISPDNRWFEQAAPVEKGGDGIYRKSAAFSIALQNANFRIQVEDLIELGLRKYIDDYSNPDVGSNLVVNKKYSRKDVCRILNWEKEENPQNMGGYRIKYGTCPIFVTLNKKGDIADSINYEEGFLSRRAFSWKTRSGVAKDSKETIAINNYARSGLKLFLFVKKSDDDDGKDYYYLGRVIPIDSEEQKQPVGNGKEKPIMKFDFELKSPVKEELYEYLTT
jgi:hypothetical protein